MYIVRGEMFPSLKELRILCDASDLSESEREETFSKLAPLLSSMRRGQPKRGDRDKILFLLQTIDWDITSSQ